MAFRALAGGLAGKNGPRLLLLHRLPSERHARDPSEGSAAMGLRAQEGPGHGGASKFASDS